MIVIKHLHFVNLPLSQSGGDFIVVKQFNVCFHCVDLPLEQSICDFITVNFPRLLKLFTDVKYYIHWCRSRRYVNVFLSLEIGSDNKVGILKSRQLGSNCVNTDVFGVLKSVVEV